MGGRHDLLAPLLAQLPAGTQVVTDPGVDDPQRSPWRCYRACLETVEATDTHLLIVQDDAQLCRDFPAALEAVVASRPNDPLCLFVPGFAPNVQHILEACWRGDRWCALDWTTFVPVVAVVYPRETAHHVLRYALGQQYPAFRAADDSILGDFARDTRTTFWATVPSLVEHPDRIPSLVGTAHFAGLAPHRIAACWTGPEMSGLDFDW